MRCRKCGGELLEHRSSGAAGQAAVMLQCPDCGTAYAQPRKLGALAFTAPEPMEAVHLAACHLLASFGREPSTSAIAELFGWSRSTYRARLAAPTLPVEMTLHALGVLRRRFGAMRASLSVVTSRAGVAWVVEILLEPAGEEPI